MRNSRRNGTIGQLAAGSEVQEAFKHKFGDANTKSGCMTRKARCPITLPALFMQEVKKEVATKEPQQELRKILKGEFRCIKMKTAGLGMITLAPDQIVSDMHLRQAEAALSSDTLILATKDLKAWYTLR